MSAIQMAVQPQVHASWLKRYSLVAYFALAYGFSWILVALVLFALQFGLLASNSPVTGVVSQFIVFGPAIAALIVTAIIAGRVGVGHLLRRLVQWRVSIRWYLIVLFGVPFALVIGESILFSGAPLAQAGVRTAASG
jgi:hypothetical protein